MGVILAIVVIAAAGVAFYFWSDPFRTKTNATLKQLSEWTPENITADPVGHLDFCEEEATTAEGQLKATEISIAQRRGTLEGMRSEADKTIQVGEKSLARLKAAYKGAAAENKWPIDYLGNELDRDAAKRQIVSLHQEIQSKKALRTKVEAGLTNLDVQKTKILEARADADRQLSQIKAHREILRVQLITDDLTEQLVSMRGVLETTIASAAAESDGGVTLDHSPQSRPRPLTTLNSRRSSTSDGEGPLAVGVLFLVDRIQPAPSSQLRFVS